MSSKAVGLGSNRAWKEVEGGWGTDPAPSPALCQEADLSFLSFSFFSSLKPKDNCVSI